MKRIYATVYYSNSKPRAQFSFNTGIQSKVEDAMIAFGYNAAEYVLSEQVKPNVPLTMVKILKNSKYEVEVF